MFPLLTKITVYTIMGLAVFAALAAVSCKNLFHSALALIAVLLGVAGIFIFLQAEFLAMVQILIYVGAVMTLVIFTIMLTERIGDKQISQNNHQSLLAASIMLALLFFMIRLIQSVAWPVKESTLSVHVGTEELAKALLGPYVFPFEVISVVLIAALIGAIVIARKDNS